MLIERSDIVRLRIGQNVYIKPPHCCLSNNIYTKPVPDFNKCYSIQSRSGSLFILSVAIRPFNQQQIDTNKKYHTNERYELDDLLGVI